jgi:hypothetical protein
MFESSHSNLDDLGRVLVISFVKTRFQQKTQFGAVTTPPPRSTPFIRDEVLAVSGACESYAADGHLLLLQRSAAGTCIVGVSPANTNLGGKPKLQQLI